MFSSSTTDPMNTWLQCRRAPVRFVGVVKKQPASPQSTSGAGRQRTCSSKPQQQAPGLAIPDAPLRGSPCRNDAQRGWLRHFARRRPWSSIYLRAFRSTRVSLDVVDISSIKINEAKPRRLSVTMERLRSTQVGGIGMRPSVARGSVPTSAT